MRTDAEQREIVVIGGASGAALAPSTVTTLSVSTAVVGTNYTAFASTPCSFLDVVNNTGTTIEFRRNGAGTPFPIFTGTSKRIAGITNASQIGVRRVDVSNTPVTVVAEALA